MIFNADAALRILVNSRAFRDPAAEEPGWLLSSAGDGTWSILKARPQAVREFWEFMLLHAANTSGIINEVMKQVRTCQGCCSAGYPTQATFRYTLQSKPVALIVLYVNCWSLVATFWLQTIVIRHPLIWHVLMARHSSLNY